MKITILDEKDIMEAISKLTEFVRSQYPDATVNGNMTVYVSLDGEREDNRRDFTIYKDGSVSSAEGETSRIRKEVSDEYKEKWKSYTENIEYNMKLLERRMQVNENYVRTAKENLRDPQKVEDRKAILEKQQEQMEGLKADHKLAMDLKYAKRITWFRTGTGERKMYWIFWHYDKPVSFDGEVLKRGFPEFFSKADEVKAREIYERKFKLL